MCFIARRPALHRPSLFLLTSAGAASRTENLRLALSRASEAWVWTIRHRRGVRTLSHSSRGSRWTRIALAPRCYATLHSRRQAQLVVVLPDAPGIQLYKQLAKNAGSSRLTRHFIDLARLHEQLNASRREHKRWPG